MLTLMKSSGSFFSSQRRHISKINYYAEKINKYYQSQPEKALEYVNKLIAYHNKLQGEKNLSKIVKQWFVDNNIDKVKERIELIMRVNDLSATTQLGEIYEQYNGKDSFKTLIEAKLLEKDEQITVHSLEGGNNPIVRVSSNDQCFIIRFLRMNKDEESSNRSPRNIRARYSEKIPQIPQPYLLEQVEDDGHEITYMEYSKFYPNGNLQDHFNNLRDQKERGLLTNEDFNKELLIYAEKLVLFFITINEHHVWYTDLKPSNILLDNKDIVISDIKGLIQSRQVTVPSNMTNTSQTYYQSTVYNDKMINLELLQSQTLATTIYQLACGKLPKQKVSEMGVWKNIYNFKQQIFTGEDGHFLKELITRLNLEIPTTMDRVLAQIDERLYSDEIELSELLASEDSELIELPPPRKPGSYTKL